MNSLPSTIAALTRDNLARFHSSYWKPASSALVFAGDITFTEAKELAESQFGSWQGGAAPDLVIPARLRSVPVRPSFSNARMPHRRMWFR
jgi:predicted Zn-dependent peptidase